MRHEVYSVDGRGAFSLVGVTNTACIADQMIRDHGGSHNPLMAILSGKTKAHLHTLEIFAWDADHGYCIPTAVSNLQLIGKALLIEDFDPVNVAEHTDVYWNRQIPFHIKCVTVGHKRMF